MATITSIPVPEAQVVIGTVQPTDPPSAFAGNGLFPDYQIQSRFIKNNHRYMMGITSPAGTPTGGSAAFVQLAAPTLIWLCEWTAFQIGSPPPIPSPVSVNPDWILLDHEEYDPVMLILGPDGVTPCYRISGIYIYGHKNPAAVTVNNVNFSIPPWMVNVFDRSMPASNLVQGLTQ